jgi:O-methyltransferase involved in polyketide biosynthesis
MDTNQSYKTAYTAAYARLVEQYEPKEKRLFDDTIVKYFFSNYISSLLKVRLTKNA